MYFAKFAHLIRFLFVAFSFAIISGCATSHHTTHYGIFEAENSAGDVRLFRVYWQTVRYQSWGSERFQAFPIVLQTQCSQRELFFYDASLGQHRRCDDRPGEGIHFCADPSRDESRRGTPIDGAEVCAIITDKRGAKTILDLQGEILITLECQPKVKERRVNGKRVNTDFLLGSSLPYIVATKSVEGSDLESILPEVSQHSSICDPSD